MDAPHISTLDTQEDATPPPLASKDSSTTFILEQPQAAHAHPQTPQQTKPLRVVRDPMQPHREVYVLEDDEEDQLIDDDDEVGGPSRAAAAAALAPSTSVIRDMVGPSVPAPSPRPPPANSLPEHMLPSNHPPSGPVSTSDRPSPSPRKRNAKPKKLVDEANAPIGIPVIFPVAKKKRVRTAIKATLEVVRQEPETHDNTGTTSAWRLDTPNPIVQDEVKPPVKRRRGPRNSGQGTVSAPPQPVAPATAPPPRKRIRTVKPQIRTPEDTTPEAFAGATSYHESTPDNIPPMPPPVEYPVTGPSIHVTKFRVPADNLESLPDSALDAAPTRPLPFATNAIAPGSYLPWQSYSGPLDKSGKKCRRWDPKLRSIKTIGGGVWFAKTWIGAQTSEVDYTKPPLVVEVNKPPADVKPVKVKPTRRRPRNKNNNNLDTSSAAPTPPPGSTPINMADAAQELEGLAGR